MTVKKDSIVIGPQISENQRLVTRYKDGEKIKGVVSPIEEGKPIRGSIVELSHMSGNEYEVTDEFSPGPPKVNSKAYKAGWDRTFN